MCRFIPGTWIFLVHEAGLEPARPKWTLEPESSESANSTTRANKCRRRNPSNMLDYTSIFTASCQ